MSFRTLARAIEELLSEEDVEDQLDFDRAEVMVHLGIPGVALDVREIDEFFRNELWVSILRPQRPRQ